MIDTKKLEILRKRAERFQVESSAQQIADLAFLLSVVDELLATKQKAQFLITQIMSATEEEVADYRRASLASKRVCTKTAFDAAMEATA